MDVIRSERRMKDCASCQHAVCKDNVKMMQSINGVLEWAPVVICELKHISCSDKSGMCSKWEPVQ